MVGEHTIDLPGAHLVQKSQFVDGPHVDSDTVSLAFIHSRLGQKSTIGMVILNLEILGIAAHICKPLPPTRKAH